MGSFKGVGILILLFAVLGCNNKKFDQPYLVEGTFYHNGHDRMDTLLFTKKIPERKFRKWNYQTWKVSKDSIYQEDDHGLYRLYGRDKCTYTLMNDTLIVRYFLNSPTKYENKYIVLQSNRNILELVQINRSDVSKFRSDIQLR